MTGEHGDSEWLGVDCWILDTLRGKVNIPVVNSVEEGRSVHSAEQASRDPERKEGADFVRWHVGVLHRICESCGGHTCLLEHFLLNLEAAN